MTNSSSPFGDPSLTFDAIPLSSEVRTAVDRMGFKSPTPVQLAVFESASAGRDLVVQARTGTGKTAAFGLPLIDRLIDSSRPGVQSIILAPTRELALQISRQLEALAQLKGTKVTAIYGGASMQPQIDALRAGAQIVVGTPGRVLDHLERRTLDVSGVKVAVLDESDEMLSMGFLPQITAIFERLPLEKQTLLFSATLPPGVKRIAEGRLRNPEFITLSGDHVGALSIEHYVYTSRGDKSQEVVRLLEIENPESAILFCNTREQTKRIAGALQEQGYPAEWLNADLSQSDRERVMQATRDGKLRFLVATDVAARGIDISHLTHVINADFPESTENYVHRTGRTGRAGRTGKAVSLIAPQDVGNLYMLRLTYKIFPVERELPTPEELRAAREADLLQELRRRYPAHKHPQASISLARRLAIEPDAESLISALLVSFFEKEPGFEFDAQKRRVAPGPMHGHAPKREHEPRKRHHDERVVSEEARVVSGESEDEHSDKKKKKKKKKDKKHKHDHEHAEGDFLHADDAAVEPVLDAPTDAIVMPSSPPAESPVRPETPAIETAGLETMSAADALAALEGHTPDSDEARIFIDLGKRDSMYREDFLDVLEDAGFPADGVIAVKLRDNNTFVSVAPELLERALDILDGATIGGLVARAEKARPRSR